MDKPKRWVSFYLAQYKNGEITNAINKQMDAEGGLDVVIADEMDAYIADLARRVLEEAESAWYNPFSIALQAELKRLAEGGE